MIILSRAGIQYLVAATHENQNHLPLGVDLTIFRHFERSWIYPRDNFAGVEIKQRTAQPPVGGWADITFIPVLLFRELISHCTTGYSFAPFNSVENLRLKIWEQVSPDLARGNSSRFRRCMYVDIGVPALDCSNNIINVGPAAFIIGIGSSDGHSR